MTLPDNSDLNIFSTYVPTCMSFPLPVVPKSSTPAISLANLKGKYHGNVVVEHDNYLISHRYIHKFKSLMRNITISTCTEYAVTQKNIAWIPHLIHLVQ